MTTLARRTQAQAAPSTGRLGGGSALRRLAAAPLGHAPAGLHCTAGIPAGPSVAAGAHVALLVPRTQCRTPACLDAALARTGNQATITMKPGPTRGKRQGLTLHHL
ncbi:uncharacterized protein LOC142570756 [Dermacentor variabilis]|uniref:uncharacterized protein LOC142570756 n=1 Tax=Dermacentor variabilis TaxID=34621 RepID=UPI003F5C5356